MEIMVLTTVFLMDYLHLRHQRILENALRIKGG